MANPIPDDITANRASKTLTIHWKSGETCQYSFSLLRKACPCAVCKGEGPAEDPDLGFDGLNLPLVDSRSTMIKKVELVGNYALNIEWEDGHHYGIYNWEYLMALCPAGDA